MMIQTKIKTKKVIDTDFFADMFAAIEHGKTNENSTNSSRTAKESNLVSSGIVSGNLVDTPEKNDEQAAREKAFSDLHNSPFFNGYTSATLF